MPYVKTYTESHPLVIAYMAQLNSASPLGQEWTAMETHSNIRLKRGNDCVFMIDCFTGSLFITKTRTVWARGKWLGKIDDIVKSGLK